MFVVEFEILMGSQSQRLYFHSSYMSTIIKNTIHLSIPISAQFVELKVLKA